MNFIITLAIRSALDGTDSTQSFLGEAEDFPTIAREAQEEADKILGCRVKEIRETDLKWKARPL